MATTIGLLVMVSICAFVMLLYFLVAPFAIRSWQSKKESGQPNRYRNPARIPFEIVTFGSLTVIALTAILVGRFLFPILLAIWGGFLSGWGVLLIVTKNPKLSCYFVGGAMVELRRENPKEYFSWQTRRVGISLAILGVAILILGMTMLFTI